MYRYICIDINTVYLNIQCLSLLLWLCIMVASFSALCLYKVVILEEISVHLRIKINRYKILATIGPSNNELLQ